VLCVVDFYIMILSHVYLLLLYRVNIKVAPYGLSQFLRNGLDI